MSPHNVALAVGAALIIAAVPTVAVGFLRGALLLGAGVGFLIWFVVLPHRWYRNVIPILLTIAIVVGLIAARNTSIPFVSRSINSFQPIVFLSDAHLPEDAVARFVRDNTPEGAILLTPPQFSRFRLTARRAIVVDFKTTPFQDWALVEWSRRMTDCYGEVTGKGFQALEEMRRHYMFVNSETILLVANKYGASYAVLYEETPCEFPTLYKDDKFKVVSIPCPERRTLRGTSSALPAPAVRRGASAGPGTPGGAGLA